MAIQATNYDGTKIYNVAEIADVYHPNLLVNGDFQINQRGQTEYNFNKQGGYGLDMWQHRQGNYYQALIVTPIKGGGVHVKLGTNVGAGLRQYLDVDKFKIGQSYTTVIKIDNTEYKGMIILENSFKAIIENDVFMLELGFVEENKIAYSLWFKNGNSEYDIWYVDLFEGDIAYPHVKEDKTIALVRCSEYVKVINYNTSKYCSYENYVQDTFMFEIPMASNPTYQIVEIGTSINVKSATINVTKERVLLATFATATGILRVQDKKCLISCEPL